MKKKNRLIRVSYLLALFIALGLGIEARAATYTFNVALGAGTYDWTNSTANVWTVGGSVVGAGVYPGPGDDVVIGSCAASNTVRLDANITVNSVAVTGSSLFVPTLSLNGKTLTTTGNVTITAGGTANFDATISGATASSALVVGGNLTVTGATGSATLNMNTSRTALSVAGNISSSNLATTIIDLSNCDVSVTGTITIGATTVTTTANTTVLTLDGTSVVTLPDDFTPLGRLNVNKTGIGYVNQAATTAATIIDSVYINSGKLLLATPATNIFTVNELLYLADNSNAELSANAAASALTIKKQAYFGPSGIFTTNALLTMILGNVGAGTGTTDITLPNNVTNLNVLTIERAAATSAIYLTNNLTTASTLTITAGKLVPGTNTLTTGSTFTTAASANAVLDATGSTLVFNGILNPVFGAGSVITTSSTTNIAVNTTAAANINAPAAITSLNNFTLSMATGRTYSLGGNLTLAGALTISNGGFVVGANTLTVGGNFTATGANAIFTTAGSTVVLNGAISANNAANTDFTTTTLTIGGSGAISITAPTAQTGITALTMNRSGITFPLYASAAFTATGAVTVTNGIVDLASARAYIVSGATTIATGGKLVGTANTSTTFNGALAGAGTFDATGKPVTIGDAYNFTGNFITSSTTSLTINGTSATDVSLQASIANLNSLTIAPNGVARNVAINGNLTLAGALTFTPIASASSVLTIGANRLIVTGAFTAPTGNGAYGINASNGTLELTGLANLVDPVFTLTTNNATNLILTGGTGANYPTSANVLNNLTIGAATTLPAVDMTINGNLTVSAGTLTTSTTKNISVSGTLSNAGTIAATASTNLYLNADLTGSGAWTNPERINLFVIGTGAQLSIPGVATMTALNTIVVNRPNGVRINSNLTIGAGVTGAAITLTSGTFDLNGFAVTLGATTAQISENVNGGSVFTNTGNDNSGFVSTALEASPYTATFASGIGITSLTGPTGNVTVKRFPKYKTIPNVNMTVSRYYHILSSAGIITAVTAKYDNSELGSNSAGSLKMYAVKGVASTTPADFLGSIDSASTNTNTPGSGTGTIAGSAFAATANLQIYVAFASQSGSTGVVRVFNNAGGDGYWSTATNWNPSGVPTKDDDVTIGANTVVLSGNNRTYECKSLTLSAASSQLKPYDNPALTGDNIDLVVLGNINIQSAGASIDAVNGNGRINITIGDGVTPISSTITPAQDYTTGNGFSVNNITIKSAAVATAGSNKVRIVGNMDLQGTSVYTDAAGTTAFYGGYANQTITNVLTSAINFCYLTFENSANVTSASSFKVTKQITMAGPSDKFVATNGTITIQPAGAEAAWNVFPGATLKPWGVTIVNAAGAITPVGNIEIQGDFSYSSTGGVFTHASGDVKFVGALQKTIINSAANTKLQFRNLVVAPGSSAKTSSSFNVIGNIDVQTNAALVADNGTIYFTTAGSIIKNTSDHTLKFYNLDIGAIVTTSDSWKIAGNLNISAGSLTADNGTITFENGSTKTIAGNNFTAYKLAVSDGSAVTTATSFTVANNITNKLNSGFEVLGTGSFKATAGTITFSTTTNPGAGYPKTITKASGATLEFYNLAIGTAVNNEVTTASDFTIIGLGSAFVNSNASLGGIFNATAGTVTFSGIGATITSATPDVTTFYNVNVANTTLTLFAASYMNIAGNLVVDGVSGVFTNTANAAGLVKFNGTTQQKITGTSTITAPVTISRLEINKTVGTTTDKEVVLEKDVTIIDAATSNIFLTSGYLNLGSKKLIVGDGNFTYTSNGAINGATGTYDIVNTATGVLLRDAMFTVNGVPTLYNLIAEDNETLDGDLTVNGNLALTTGALDINGFNMTVYGNLSRTTGTIPVSAGRLILTGTGSVSGFDNSYFGGAACLVNLTIARTENLSGNLTLGAGKDLTMNTGIGYFNLGTNILDLQANNPTFTRISGSITAPASSSVKLGSGIPNIAANMFTNNECFNLDISGTDRVLDGDLTVNGTMAGVQKITTGLNSLTFSRDAVLPVFTNVAHVVGNLRRTVVATSAIVFPVGDGSATTYRPVTLQFATSGSEQVLQVSSKNTDPTIGRGGNSYNAVDAAWTMTPIGTIVADSMKVSFSWPTALEGTGKQGTVVNGSFPAKWTGTAWKDYRNNLSTYTVSSPRVVAMTGYPLASPSDLTGVWAVFNSDSNTTSAKNRAISTSANKVKIISLSPNPVVNNQVFKVTVQLQDQYGQAINSSNAFAVTVSQDLGTTAITGATLTGIIKQGTSLVELAGVYAKTGNGGESNHILKADTTGGSYNWQPSQSPLFNIVGTEPDVQSSAITFSNIKSTTVDINFTSGNPANNQMLVVKADTLLKTGTEYPVNGTTYLSNIVYGAGSSIGEGVVLYKNDDDHSSATGTKLRVYGLSPNTKYYFYIFDLTGGDGNEYYKVTPASLNPNIVTTVGGTDDDVALGTNDTRANAKMIGTNTPVTGTMKSAADADWYAFTVTNTTPNVRVKLYNVPGNYTLELYDMTGRRIRRSTLNGTLNEAMVVNNLTPGTYTVKIFSQDGSYWTKSGDEYKLKVSTFSSEIFSVTP